MLEKYLNFLQAIAMTAVTALILLVVALLAGRLLGFNWVIR